MSLTLEPDPQRTSRAAPGGVRPIQKVAVLAQDGMEPFGFGAIMEVWDEPYHPEDDNPVFDLTVCAPVPGPQRSRGISIDVQHDLGALDDADLVCVVPKSDHTSYDPAAIEALRAASARGAWISAHCNGVFMLGEAGLLDGRRCTTHWRYGDEIQRRFPASKVETDVLYVLDGNILTGAGSAAGIDSSLHLMRTVFGSRVAATTARRIVMPPHRDGGQAQYVRTVVRGEEAETLAPLLERVTGRLDESWPVERMARETHMSMRTFARRFRDETGTTPLQWLTLQRVALAEELLEQSDLSVEQIAARSGFGAAGALRHHFSALRGVTPIAYRRTFCDPR